MIAAISSALAPESTPCVCRYQVRRLDATSSFAADHESAVADCSEPNARSIAMSKRS